MRQVVLSAAISLDGYIARPNGSVDFLGEGMDPEVAASMGEFFKTIDTAIMGRKTYEVALAMSGGQYNSYGLVTYVLSRSQPQGERGGVTFTGQSPEELVAALRAQPGKDFFLMGGGEVARAFLTAGLVDQIHLHLFPVLLGEGLPLFPAAFPQHNLERIEARTYADGTLGLRYRRIS